MNEESDADLGTTLEPVEISVVMPFHNQVEFIAEAIHSILKQSFRNFECILVDDCSNDGSRAVAEKIAEQDKRIRIIENLKNEGLTRSINRGLDLAKGKYIARMDADDIALPERFALQKEFLDQHSDITLIGTQFLNFSNTDGTQTKSILPTHTNEIIEQLGKGKNCFAHPSIMFRNAQGWRYREKFRYAQDFDFYLMLLSQGAKFSNLPDLLLHYRLQPNSTSFSKRIQQSYFKREAFRFFLERQINGQDAYEQMDEASILSIEGKASSDPFLMRNKIDALFKLNDMQEARLWMRKYFKTKGYLKKYYMYWLASYLPIRLINQLRVWLWK